MTGSASSLTRRAGQPRGPPASRTSNYLEVVRNTRALDDVSLAFVRRECHTLVGRNGAGKSTLVGVSPACSRRIRAACGSGRADPSPGDRAASQRRVACVYRAVDGRPHADVGRERVPEPLSAGRFVSWRGMRRGPRPDVRVGFDLDVDLLAADLSVEQRRIVEIARALSIGARFLILDEPTASLEATARSASFFDHVRRLKESGVGILYISHHLEEVYEICDRATVLRDGKRDRQLARCGARPRPARRRDGWSVGGTRADHGGG